MAKVYSMTGFGLGLAQLSPGQAVNEATRAGSASAPVSGAARLSLELRSVNSRFLDISFKLPDEFRPHEAQLREAIAARCKRGKIEVRGQIERRESLGAEIDAAALQTLLTAQDKVLAHDANARRLSVSDLLRWPGVIAGDRADDAALAAREEAMRQALLAALELALQGFAASRANEGEKLAQFLLERCDAIERHAEQAKQLAPQAVQKQQQRFLERWAEALKLATPQLTSDDAVSITERAHERALSEAAAFAIRIDIAEEIGRLQAHTSECRALLAKGGELGKRLDFLVQELHREANTLGSKSASLEHTKVAIELKVLVEQMREQVQNIE